MKRLTYLSGTRADFGLMERTLKRIASSDQFDLELVVTGMHLSDRFGRTEREVTASGLRVALRIDVPIDEDSSRGMGVAAGIITSAMANYFAERPRDGIILLGDRGEMLSAAIAALYASVPVIHIAGGERSGSVDESIRHAITKLAHVHLVSTEDGRRRVIGLGEQPGQVHRVGAPGLAGLLDCATTDLGELARKYGFDPARPYALLLHHPVVQDAQSAGDQWRAIFAALEKTDLQVVALLPNADYGTDAIRREIDRQTSTKRLIKIEHMPRSDYVSALRHARFLIGNSSSGIVEAATLQTPVVNIGDRQAERLRSANVFDASYEPASIACAIDLAEKFDPAGLVNVFGGSDADTRICEILAAKDLSDPDLLKKSMTY
ncbi:UDP-N-acetylglucosamine 2-epimerase [Qipengyuania sp. DY56-A-20]|uniref:UDP-N-acetylglucosamine 2-epimerase n=1 Tax=Qipengyuania benthica TaxID=3067651 RepID=A0ABT9HC26_9SPHN|nr:UDP-N-acetylglucosamine 2-epimerase [Qipengyuania sp. DY56-A-20]MDP4540579.1 UDP-N-acetylglucosamine 2-epimerase [Qipengyuania sp. DY56-A-20]